MSTTSPEQARPTPPEAGGSAFAAAPSAPAGERSTGPTADPTGAPPAPRAEPFWRRRWVLWVGAALLALLLAGGGFVAGFTIGVGTAASAASGFPDDRGDRFGPRGDGMPPGAPDTDTDGGDDSGTEGVVPDS